MKVEIPEFFRVFLVSVVALAGDTATLVLLTHVAHVHYLVSAAVAFGVGLVISYFLSIKWGFSSRKITDRRRELIIYCLIGIAGAGFNELLLWGFTGMFGWQVLASKAVSVGTVYWWNYGMRKVLLF